VEAIPYAAPLGALVRCGDVRALDEAGFREVYRAYLAHLVIVIRGQRLSDEELLAFSARFGELDDVEPMAGLKATPPSLAIVSNVIENGMAIGRLGYGEAVWHTDSSFHAVPPSATVLYSLEVPTIGGDTGFANTYLAFETLPPQLRERIEGRTIKHDKRYTASGKLRAGHSESDDIRQSPGPSHPIVRRHPETGYRALYLGRRTNSYVNGLSVAESEALLDELWAHATKPQFTWHHKWQPGDIVVWDNRCVLHRRDAFDPAARRILHRTQCRGTSGPEAPDRSEPHPRGETALASR
jgi:taurine dioxygenase